MPETKVWGWLCSSRLTYLLLEVQGERFTHRWLPRRVGWGAVQPSQCGGKEGPPAKKGLSGSLVGTPCGRQAGRAGAWWRGSGVGMRACGVGMEAGRRQIGLVWA